jgi:O-methyltransferase involved in polyketide biosynthesis
MSSVSLRVDPKLDGVPETLLIPLWARAQEQTHAHPIIIDPWSAGIVSSLDYDFDRFRSKHVEVENFCVRASVMDRLISDILAASPGRNVVEFGPGLDTRFYRVGQHVDRWTEVDLPEVISLRERFFPADEARSMVSCSMMDDEWIEQVHANCDEPPLFIAEGVFYFFSGEQIRRFLTRLHDAFPGAGLVFDAVSPWFLKLSNLRHPLKTSRLQFALSPFASEISRWDSRNIVENYIGFGDAPNYDGVMHRFSWWKRFARQTLPLTRHSFMIVHVDFQTGQEQR